MAAKKQENKDNIDAEPIAQVDGARATAIVREYLEQNYGNVGMLYYRIERLERNGKKTQFYVTCSLLSGFGSKERLYYRFKVNIADGDILDVWRSKPVKEDDAEIVLEKVNVTEKK